MIIFTSFFQSSMDVVEAVLSLTFLC